MCGIRVFHIASVYKQANQRQGVESDGTLGNRFLEIIQKGKKNNDYKFALARFLINYDGDAHVKYETIARGFFKYYYYLHKEKLKHAPDPTSKLRVIQEFKKYISDEKFPKYYYEDLDQRELESKEVKSCINGIVENGLHNVIRRFQETGKAKHGEVVNGPFYRFRISDGNLERLDLEYGIFITSDARNYFKRNKRVMESTTVCEWSRFLEGFNVGVPNILEKLETFRKPVRASLYEFRMPLKNAFGVYGDNKPPICFYCEEGIDLNSARLSPVDHVFPYDFVTKNELWNLVYACQSCNSRKSNQCIDKTLATDLVDRNQKCVDKEIKSFKTSISNIGGFRKMEERVWEHFEVLKSRRTTWSRKIAKKLKMKGQDSA
ncbi:putative HNH endonuclease [Nitrosopumilaceae archaeon]|nr:putative HNH endonuclease [Nitrosopumilaceae archaeon]